MRGCRCFWSIRCRKRPNQSLRHRRFRGCGELWQFGRPSRHQVDTSNDADEPILTIKKRVDEVNVLFIATDRHGKFVRNLNQNDFSIFDDHKPVESILNFRRETDLPIELGLLMDVSGSVQGRFGFEKEAATGFLQHIIRPGYDRAFVVGFNKESHLTQDFTDQVPLLAAGVQRLNDDGGTALYDAIYKACKEKLLREQFRPSHSQSHRHSQRR